MLGTACFRGLLDSSTQRRARAWPLTGRHLEDAGFACLHGMGKGGDTIFDWFKCPRHDAEKYPDGCCAYLACVGLAWASATGLAGAAVGKAAKGDAKGGAAAAACALVLCCAAVPAIDEFNRWRNYYCRPRSRPPRRPPIEPGHPKPWPPIQPGR